MSQRKGAKGSVERSKTLEAKRQARIEERGGKQFLEAQEKALRKLGRDRARIIMASRQERKEL